MRSFRSILLLILFCFSTFYLTFLPKEVYGIEKLTKEESRTTEKVAVDNDSVPLYNITKLNFDGNKHFSQRKLRDMFGWESKRLYSRNEIREGFNRIMSSYRPGWLCFCTGLACSFHAFI